MKNNTLVSSAIFLLATLAASIGAQSQTLSLACDALNFGCQYALPNASAYNYNLDMTGFSKCNNGKNCKYKWEVTNGVILGGTVANPSVFENDGASFITVKWNNFNGNGKIKVTSGKPAAQGDCQSCPVGMSYTKDIPIKYLGTPGNIKINGNEYAGSYQLNCGSSPITVSVAPVTNATSYVWSYPAGWSHSGSANTIVITPHASSSGTIKVTASRSDVAGLTTSSQLNITRPLPTIPVINSGAILLCAPKDITATASNATSYNWVSTGGITASSPAKTNTAHLTGVSDGTVKVSATSSVCGVTTAFSMPVQVKRSAPLAAALIVTENGGGSPDFMCNGTGVSLNAYTSEPETKFSEWTVTDPANAFLNYSGGSAYFNSYVNNCYGIDVIVSNCFGSVQKGITICVDYCLTDKPVYKVYPNPANDIINVTFDAVADIQSLPETIRVFSEATSKEVRNIDLKDAYSVSTFPSDRTVSIPANDLPKGTYYLHFERSKLIFDKVRIILE